MKNVSVVSVAGGHRDVLVRSELSAVESFLPQSQGFTVFATSVPTVGVSGDHQCILWCNQFVKVVAKTLLELIDPKTRQATFDVSRQLQILQRDFLR